MISPLLKVWSDKARAAALAKRRGQAAPTTPQQSQTAEQAVAHANQLIASGILNKGKKGKGGKGKGAGKAPKAKDPAVAKEHAQRLAEHAADRAQRQADRQTRLTEHTAAQTEHAQSHAEHEADRTQRQIEHQQALIAKQKAAVDKAKAAAKPKPKASGSPKGAARAGASIAKQQAHGQAQQAKEQSRIAAAATHEIAPELAGAAHVLMSGAKPDKAQEAGLIGKGLAKRQKDGSLSLTTLGKKVAQQHADQFDTKGMPMPATKASARHSAADTQAIKDAHDMSVAQGALCPTPAAKAGARHSAADVGHFQGMHDHAAALVDGAHCVGMAKAVGDMADPLADATPPAPDEEAGEGEDDEEEEDTGHTGLMIALQVPPDVASELALDGDVAPEELHLTLAFLGDAADFQKQQFAILASVEKVLTDAQPLAATIGGVGRFATPEDDGTNAFYASVDCPELADFRQSLIDALSESGITIDETHGFTPHITLAYIPAGAPTPGDMPSVTDLTFSTVIVAFGDHQVLFPLGDPAADEAALEDEQDAGADDASEQPDGALMKSVGDDTLIAYGGAIKSLPNGHVGGYLVRFSGPNDPDLTGDFFTPDTDFGFTPGETLKTAVYFNHRLPLKTRDGGQMTIKQKIGSGILSMDDTGVFIDAVLYNRERYESTLAKQGWSSGTASHLVDREMVGKSMWVKSWQLGLDASITPTPAEPRTSVLSLKSFLADTHSPEALPQTGRTPVTRDATANANAAPDLLIIVRR